MLASFCSSAAPRRFLPITLPVGSIRKFCGILYIWYCCATAFCHPLRSLTWGQVRLSILMASIHGFFALSNETPSTVKFLFLYLLNAATTFGFSWRHGPHQLAQKSTSTYFPFNDERLRLLPAVSV